MSIGFSMGGYAALRFAKALRLTEVVLISAQVSIHPDVVPWDRRYLSSAEGFDRFEGELGLHGKPDLAGFALFDPFRRMDRYHADAINMLFPDIQLCRFAGGGHPATKAMRATRGKFTALQKALRDGTLGRQMVLDLHRHGRQQSPYYWGRLAEAAARHNHTRVAKIAADRARQETDEGKG